MRARWPPKPEPNPDADQPHEVNHRDDEAAAEDPTKQCEGNTDLVPGEREPMLLSDDARHSHPDRECKRVTQDEERRGDRVHTSSMPEKRWGADRFAPDAVPDLDVGQLERRQEPVCMAPRRRGEQCHLGSSDDQSHVDRCRQEYRRDRSSERCSSESALPPGAQLADRYRRPEIGATLHISTGRVVNTHWDVPVEEVEDRADQEMGPG